MMRPPFIAAAPGGAHDAPRHSATNPTAPVDAEGVAAVNGDSESEVEGGAVAGAGIAGITVRTGTARPEETREDSVTANELGGDRGERIG
jgi:hypothetical protein